MRAEELGRHGSLWDRWDGLDSSLALLATACAGVGVTIALGGAAGQSVPAGVVGGALAVVGFGVLFTAGWVDPLPVTIVAIPLPAVVQSGDLRVAAVAPVAAMAVVTLFLRRASDSRPLRLGDAPFRSATALGGAFIFSSLFAVDSLAALRETLNLLVLLALIVLAVLAFRDRPGRARLASRLLVGAGAVCGVLAPLEVLGVLPGEFPLSGTAYNRASLGFGQPNGLGLFQAVVLPLAVYEVGRSSGGPARVVAGAALGAVVLGLFASFSRGSWVAATAGSVTLFLLPKRGLAVRVWAGILTSIVVLDLLSGGLVRERVERTVGDWVVVQRLALAEAGIRMFADRPLTGVGPGGYDASLERYGAQIPQLWDLRATPHNAYIQMAAEAGVLGLGAFLSLLASAFLVLIPVARAPPEPGARLETYLLWSLGVIVVAGFTVWPLSHGAGEGVALVLALAIAAAASVGTEGVEGGGRSTTGMELP